MLAAAATASAAGLLVDALFSFPAYRALPPWLLALDAAHARRRGPRAGAGPRLPGPRARRAPRAAPARRRWRAWPCWWRSRGGCARTATSRRHGARSRKATGRVSDGGGRGGGARRRARGRLVLPGNGGPRRAESRRRPRARCRRRWRGGPSTPTPWPTSASRARKREIARARPTPSVAPSGISPGEGDVSYQLGRLLQEAGDGAGALEAFRQAAAAWPSDPRPQYRRGLLALRAHQLAEAEEALRAAVALDPSGAGAHKALGVVLLQGGRRAEAATHFQEALRLDATLADRAMMERVIADASGPARAMTRQELGDPAENG